MRLLLVLLQAAIVHRSMQDDPSPVQPQPELSAALPSGFPIGSLMTFYVKCKNPGDGETGDETWKHNIDVRLHENYLEKTGHIVEFRLDCKNPANIVSNYAKKTRQGPNPKTEEDHTAWTPPPAAAIVDPWIRLDVYRLADTTYLPFAQGFNAQPRTMDVKGVSTSALIARHNTDYKTPNFAMDDVYFTLRTPNARYTPNPKEVQDALDQSIVTADPKKLTSVVKLDHFKAGTKIRLSAIMISSNLAKDNYAALLFFNADKSWAFAILNKWDEADAKVKLSLLELKTIPTDNVLNAANTNAKVDCTAAGPSSTDIVHVKLMRSAAGIKMRIYYADVAPGGKTCEIPLGPNEAKHLDGPLEIYGVQSATILHVDVF